MLAVLLFVFCGLCSWFWSFSFSFLLLFQFLKKGYHFSVFIFFRCLYIVSKALGNVAYTLSFHKLLRITNSRFQVEFRTLSTSDPLCLLLCCSCLILNLCQHRMPYQVRWWFCLWSSDLWGEKQQTVPQPDGHPSDCPHSSSPDCLLVSFLSVWRIGVNNSFRTDLMAIGCLLFYFILFCLTFWRMFLLGMESVDYICFLHFKNLCDSDELAFSDRKHLWLSCVKLWVQSQAPNMLCFFLLASMVSSTKSIAVWSIAFL